MAIYILGVGANAIKVTYAGTDLTDHVKSITINESYDEVEITAMNAVAHSFVPGLRDDSIDIEFFQDFATSSVSPTLQTYLGSTSGATLIIQSNGATVTSTAPKWTLVGAPYTYSPIDGEVGNPSMTKVTFKPVAGQSITYATA